MSIIEDMMLFPTGTFRLILGSLMMCAPAFFLGLGLSSKDDKRTTCLAISAFLALVLLFTIGNMENHLFYILLELENYR